MIVIWRYFCKKDIMEEFINNLIAFFKAYYALFAGENIFVIILNLFLMLCATLSFGWFLYHCYRIATGKEDCSF